MSYIQSNTVILQPAFPAGVVALNQNISAADSGKIFMLPPNLSTGAAQSVTLPAPAAGLRFKFIANGTIARAIVITSPTVNTIFGTLGLNNGGAPLVGGLIAKAGTTTFSFTATAIIGDWAEVVSDGTNYYVNGQSSVAAGFA